MADFLYKIVSYIAIIHNTLLKLNDAYEYNYSDKQLHFLIIGILGMAMIFVIYPFFKVLAKTNHVMVIAWIYVFTLILVITFAIEIGQGWTHTGVMDADDIVYGIAGFLAFFFVFAVIRGVIKGVVKLFKYIAGDYDDKYDDEEYYDDY